MSDPELEALKAQRMAELRGQQGGAGAGQKGQVDEQKRKEMMERQEEMKNSILSQVLDQDARSRLANISAAKPEKGQMLENQIIQMARFGQIQGKMNDDQLKRLLDRISDQLQKSAPTVKFDRRRAALDDDSD